jgi:hypothetical protein
MPENPPRPQPAGAAPREHWLLISHAFNMDGRAASLTVTDRVPWLQAAGVELHVVSAITGERSAACDHHQVYPAGPSALRFDLRHRLARRFGKGLRYRLVTVTVSTLLAPLIAIERVAWGLSSNWSWARPAARMGRRLARRHPMRLVYSSGGEWSAHEAARRIHERTGLPWIAEIHDPLVIRGGPDDDGRAPRPTREGRRLQRLVVHRGGARTRAGPQSRARRARLRGAAGRTGASHALESPVPRSHAPRVFRRAGRHAIALRRAGGDASAARRAA